MNKQELGDELPALTDFLSVCFHQDFLNDFRSDRQALDSYLQAHTIAEIKLVVEDLEWLLGEILDRRITDKAVGILLEEQLYCFFRPEGDENTRWLEELRVRLRMHLRGPGPTLGPPRLVKRIQKP